MFAEMLPRLCLAGPTEAKKYPIHVVYGHNGALYDWYAAC